MAAWWCGGVAMAAAAAAWLRGGSGGQLQRSRQHCRQGDDALASVTEVKQVAGWQGLHPGKRPAHFSARPRHGEGDEGGDRRGGGGANEPGGQVRDVRRQAAIVTRPLQA